MKKLCNAMLSFAIMLTLTAGMMTNAFAETEDIVPDTEAAFLYEATTDTVIYEKNADKHMIPASMTKMMTALLVLEENPELEGNLVVDERCMKRFYCSWRDAKTSLKGGEEISYYDCMKVMILASANEATCAFAFAMCDEYKDFTAKMNAKCEELGLKNTYFMDTSGLSPSNYSSPRDMCTIAKEVMKYDKFREICKQPDGVLPVSNVRKTETPYETTILTMNPNYRESKYEHSKYIIGCKTGWIPQSKNCYTACMERDGLVLYSVVMGSEDVQLEDGTWVQGSYTDTEKLLAYADSFDPEKAMAAKRKPYIIGGVTAAVLSLLIALFAYKKKKRG